MLSYVAIFPEALNSQRDNESNTLYKIQLLRFPANTLRLSVTLIGWRLNDSDTVRLGRFLASGDNCCHLTTRWARCRRRYRRVRRSRCERLVHHCAVANGHWVQAFRRGLLGREGRGFKQPAVRRHQPMHVMVAQCDAQAKHSFTAFTRRLRWTLQFVAASGHRGWPLPIMADARLLQPQAVLRLPEQATDCPLYLRVLSILFNKINRVTTSAHDWLMQ